MLRRLAWEYWSVALPVLVVLLAFLAAFGIGGKILFERPATLPVRPSPTMEVQPSPETQPATPDAAQYAPTTTELKDGIKVEAPTRTGLRLSGPGLVCRRMRVTAYCPCQKCCGPKACGVTASGQPVTANGGRFCAADKSIPFGTMLDIPGYGVVPVLDRGGVIKGDRLDVYFSSHKKALAWGVRWLDVCMEV